MQRHRESFTREQSREERNMVSRYWAIITINTFIRSTRSWDRTQYPECGDQRCADTGKLDKLEFDGRMVNVVDYKTGDPDKGIPKTKGPSDKDPNGGDYWRQAVFIKCSLIITNKKNGKLLVPNLILSNRIRKRITAGRNADQAWRHYNGHTTVDQYMAKDPGREFYIGCGKEDCHWCNLSRPINWPLLHEPEPVDEEDNWDFKNNSFPANPLSLQFSCNTGNWYHSFFLFLVSTGLITGPGCANIIPPRRWPERFLTTGIAESESRRFHPQFFRQQDSIHF